jgi:uncharacterized OB-fold protein
VSALPVIEGVFTIDPPRLLGGTCAECGRAHFPRLAQCPYCGAEAVTDVGLSDRGVLWGWTEVTNAPPGYRGPVPFGFGVVELPEGLRVITRLASPVETYEYGMPMRLRVVPLHEDDDGRTVLTWEFAPEPGA